MLAELNFFSCLRKYILCWVFLMMVGSHWRSWVMVVRRKQNESTVVMRVSVRTMGRVGLCAS